MNFKVLIPAFLLAVGVSFGYQLWQAQPSGNLTNLPSIGAANAQEADVSQIQDMVMGAEDAAVNLIEYSSFTCPHCAAFHNNVYPQLKADFIDTGKIKFVYREVYFDRPGLWASIVARCGGEMRFFGITELLHETQSEWARQQPAEIAESLKTIGKRAGLTEADIDACFSDGDNAQALVAWFQQNTQRDNISATPSFVINGELYSNMSYPDLKAVLNEKLN